jgi:predicted nucleic acid-binding Zn ribbon protein
VENWTVAVGKNGSGFIVTDSKATARVDGAASVIRIGGLLAA